MLTTKMLGILFWEVYQDHQILITVIQTTVAVITIEVITIEVIITVIATTITAVIITILLAVATTLLRTDYNANLSI